MRPGAGDDQAGGGGRQQLPTSAPVPAQRLPVNPRRHRVAPDKRKRVRTACNACNVRRVKCSGDSPCQQCSATARDCVYPAAVARVSVPLAELEELRHKVEVLERAVKEGREGEREGRAGGSTTTATSSVAGTPEVSQSQFQSRSQSLYQPQSQSRSQSLYQYQYHPLVSEDDQASTEGRLLHDPDGHARFLGETSGATFLDHLKEFMGTIFPLAHPDGTTFLATRGSYQTYDSRPLHDGHQASATPADALWLPPRDQVHGMLAELRCFVQDGNGAWPSGGAYYWGDLADAAAAAEDTRHLAFLHTALAVSSQASSTPETPARQGASEGFFGRACALLGNPLDMTRFAMADVRALTLMGFYLVEMNRRDAAYMCVSNAMHISIMHGAHRGWVDEGGKRVFWTLYVLDRWLSCLMGRPPTIMDEAIRLPPPCDAPSLPSAAGLRAHVDLSRISGHIVCNTYRVSPWDADSGPVRRPEDALRMLDRWLENLPPVLQLREPGLSDDPACCLLHMACNQLIILAIRPVFFAAVKKAFAERLTSRGSPSSLSSHPRIELLGRCVAAADANLRLARHALALNHPRKLLQAGLHFIFNAAICLMLRALLDKEPRLGRRGGGGRECDLDFVVARFDEEARLGSNYGRDCAAVLRDLRVLVQRLRPGGDDGEQEGEGQRYQVVDMGQAWGGNKVEQRGVQQPAIHVEQGHTLYEELVSWMDDDWPVYGAYG